MLYQPAEWFFYYLAPWKGEVFMSTHQFLLPKLRDAPAQNTRARLLYITRAQYSLEWNSAPHTHGCAELFFITGGHGMFQAQQARFPVAINDLVVINAGVPHCEIGRAHV